jgi:hypothetical protein
MNIQNINDLRNAIETTRRYENEIFTKCLATEITRKDEILKIKRHYVKQHKIIQQLIKNLQSLYEIQIIIEELEKKK